MMARLLYSLIFYVAQPLVWLRLLWRGRKQPEYRRHVGERYGFYPPAPARPLLWLHAVSVGETRAAEPLIEALLAKYPAHALLLTHMTPTGRETGRMYVERHPGRVIQAYLPYDLPDAAARFLAHFRPEIGVFMETELWPNLIAAARRRRIPLALVNARLSAKSQRGYQRLHALVAPAFAALDLVAAQTAADALRLRSVGARTTEVTGNLKFDVTPDPIKLAKGNNWRAEIGGRPVWLAASTRDGEEALVLDALLRMRLPRVLLILVPRHPQRFDEVAALVASRRLGLKRRSLDEFPDAGTMVWLGDSMGEMAAYYAAADLALIGGSLLPFGGQNLIEAAACGCPVIVGQHTFNFAQAADDAVACGAAVRIAGAEDLAATVEAILAHPEQRANMKEKAIAFSRSHQGATERTMALLAALTARAAR
ncbi:MAG: lipid IV(A) 3-deoxy-D-manno-octulosonic acid transferase [Rhodocyclales bacterium]|nr:lipid IV(A) 3-deoxy-D-manno-octulosonic acid transferase [Rhodocyclales bacterium]